MICKLMEAHSLWPARQTSKPIMLLKLGQQQARTGKKKTWVLQSEDLMQIPNPPFSNCVTLGSFLSYEMTVATTTKTIINDNINNSGWMTILLKS